MKMGLTLFFLLTFSCFSQQRQVYLVLAQDSDTFPNCSTHFAVNGWYDFNHLSAKQLKIPGTKLVNPLANVRDSLLYSFANVSLLSAFGSFEIPDYYYVKRTSYELDSILQILDSNSRYYRYDPAYMSKHKFVRESKELTDTQREEERKKETID